MSDYAEYCRAVETYLSKKNRGHLIRLVGPAFELVRRWAEQGLPLKIVMRGIDERVTRHEAKNKNSRRYPLHIEFCENDVLRAFDDWRRAVGSTIDVDRRSDNRATAKSLPKHLTSVMLRLTACLMNPEPWPGLHVVLNRVVRALNELREQAKTARGSVRSDLLRSLQTLDGVMMRDIRVGADAATIKAAEAEVAMELSAFRERMSQSAYEEATKLAVEQHLRVQLGLPRLGSI